MAYNKVVYDGTTLVDLTADTVDASVLLAGYTAHGKDGNAIVGTFDPLNMFYPVGSYYETSDADFDPNTAWGGTWVLEDGGRVHISSGTNIANTTSYWGSYPAGTNTFPIGERGGEPSHVLTVDQMPNHSHKVRYTGRNAGGNYGGMAGTSVDANPWYNNLLVAYEGGGEAHSNMPPYTVINRWHRTA